MNQHYGFIKCISSLPQAKNAGMTIGKVYAIKERGDGYVVVVNDRSNRLSIPSKYIGEESTSSAVSPYLYIYTNSVMMIGNGSVLISTGKIEHAKITSKHDDIGHAMAYSLSMGVSMFESDRDKIARLEQENFNLKAKAKLYDEAKVAMKFWLPGYMNAKNLELAETIPWIGKLNKDHQSDCQRYECILENLMDALGIKTMDDLEAMAKKLQSAASIIEAVKKSTKS